MADKYVDSFKFNDTGDVIKIKDSETLAKLNTLDLKIENTIHNFNYTKDYFNGGHMLLIGDSYCVNENESLDPGWSDGQGFGKLIANTLGMSLYNISVSGIGFGDYNTSYNYLTRLQKFISYSSDVLKDIRLVIFAGGANDGDQGLSLIASRIKECYELCKEKLPNAIVWSCFIGWSRNGATFEYFKRARNYWKLGCARCGMPIMRGTEWACHHWDYVGTDNLHPSTTGQQRIKDFILSGLFNNGVVNIELGENKTQFSTMNNGATTIDGNGFKCTMLNDTCTFTNSFTTFGYGSKSINFTGKDLYQVANIHSFMNGGIISDFGTDQQGVYNPTFYAMTVWFVAGQSFNQVLCMSKFTILDGSLWVSPFYSDGGALKTLVVSGFDMYPATITCSLDCC